MKKQAYNTVFGEFIKQYRKQQGWSQADLAARVGHNPQNISRIERGEISPTLYWCSEILAPALNLSTIDLIHRFEEFRASKNSL